MNLDSNYLRLILKKRGIKQCNFAQICGLNPSTVSGILNGWQPVGPVTHRRIYNGLKALGFCEAIIYSATSRK